VISLPTPNSLKNLVLLLFSKLTKKENGKWILPKLKSGQIPHLTVRMFMIKSVRPLEIPNIEKTFKNSEPEQEQQVVRMR